MNTDFDRWLGNQFAASGPFTLLFVLVRIDELTIHPLKSSYATVIGNELDWQQMRALLDTAKVPWTGCVFYVGLSGAGGPLPDGEARPALKQREQQLIADHGTANEGYFFDRDGRMLRLDPME